MSKVYSFRLNDDNPREVQAGEVINAWISKGYSLRYIVVEALLNVSEHEESSKDVTLLFRKIEMLLDKMGRENTSIHLIEENTLSLSETFIKSLPNSLKPGVRI